MQILRVLVSELTDKIDWVGVGERWSIIVSRQLFKLTVAWEAKIGGKRTESPADYFSKMTETASQIIFIYLISH